MQRWFPGGGPAMLLVLALAAMTGCYRYAVPDLGRLSDRPALTKDEHERLATVRPVRLDASGAWKIPPPQNTVDLPKVGEKFNGIVPITPELKRAIDAYVTKDYISGERALDEIEAAEPEPLLAFAAAMLRTQLLNVTGRPRAAIAALDRLTEQEMSLFGSNIDTLVRRADILLWSGDLDAAEALYTRLVGAVGEWRLPAGFILPPSNFVELGRTWVAVEKATLGLAFIALLREDYGAAMAWAGRTEEWVLEMIRLMDHPLYGIFIWPNATFYSAQGWVLVALGAAHIGVQRDPTAGEAFFDLALRYFDQSRFPDGRLAVEGAREYVLQRTGLAAPPLRQIGVLPEAPTREQTDLVKLLRQRPAEVGRREAVTLPLPGAGSVSVPPAGEKSAYGFVVTPDMEAAVRAWMGGDGEAALTHLEAAKRPEVTPLVAWQISYLRAQVLIMMGRAADAESELERTARLEIAAFGTNLNAWALRGEAKLGSGDVDGAIKDLAQVIEAIGEWRLPTLWVFPPADVAQVVALTRAHFRSHLGLATALMRRGDFSAAQAWAEAAEQLLEEVVYNIQHPLYRNYTAVDPDTFTARGINRGLLGATRIATTGNPNAAASDYAVAHAYFDAIGYTAGRVTIDAFRVRALLHIGRADLALPEAERAAALAAKQGIADLVWQMEALRGETLARLERPVEAEEAFRRAQTAVALVSGALGSDQAKRRFGIGKDDITRRLALYDLARGDLSAVFSDLEAGRARAFVDMLGNRPVATGRQSQLAESIRKLDREIRQQRLIAMAPRSGRRVDRSATETELMRRRSALLGQLQTVDSELADVFGIAEVDLSALRRLLAPGEVLAYALPEGDGPLRFLLARREGTNLIDTTLTAAQLRTLIDRLAIRDQVLPEIADQRAAALALAEGLKIGSWGAARRLYVVPSGTLYFMPWGVLDTAAPVVVLPTGSWLLRRAAPTLRAGSTVVVGDPNFGGALPPLPGARDEATEVARAYGVEPILGRFATEDEVRRQTGSGAAILHLATHGFFDAREPLRSAVFLSGNEAPHLLTAAHVFEKPLPAGLVVLSACETGRGDVTPGDDFLGLARSFYLGGSHTVVSSLWPVVDEPTRVFMTEFHRLARRGDYGRAWISARDLLRRQGHPPSVYGAFVLGGSAECCNTRIKK